MLSTAIGLASPVPAAVVSAASFEEQIAPGSIASLFGSGLSTQSLTAELDVDGLLPTELGGVTVEIDGQPARLIYVSPLQINFYLDPSLQPGPVTITVRVNGESGELPATLYDVAPGLFLLPCVRFDRGAVLEGLSSGLESFRATNPASPTDDNRTRLTLWGTGIRFAVPDGESNAASLIRVEAVDRTGRIIDLAVEYAGPAPLFFGLDQVNVVMPAILANAGFVELRIWIGDEVSNRISVLLIEEPPQGQLEVITEAGSGLDDSTGDGGPALQAALREPAATAADRQGNLYIADATARVIRKVSPDGIITKFAGTGEAGGDGDGGPAIAAKFRRPVALAVDRNGDVFVADSEDHRIRRIAADGKIYAFAGNGLDGDSGDLGLAAQASFGAPVSIAFNIHGSLFVVDQSNQRVRKIYGDGYISAFAGTGDGGPSGDGGPALLAVLTNPTSVAVGLDQSVLIGDGTRRIRRVDPTGIIRTVGGRGQDGDAESGVPFDAAPLGLGLQIASDPNGGVCITDSATNKIRVVGADCLLHTFGGTGTPGVSPDQTAALDANLNNPSGPSFGPTGEIFFASPENRLVRRLARVVRSEGGACVQSLQVAMDRGALMPEEPLYGFVRFNCPVEADTVVTLGSNHENLLVPAAVTVPAGKQLAFFQAETLVFDEPNLPTYFADTANVTANSGSFSDTAGVTLVVWREKTIERIDLSRPVVIGGEALAATVWLSRPAWQDGVVLGVSAGPNAYTHDEVLVPHRMRSVEFLVRTEPVTKRTLARVSVADPGEGPPTEGPFVIDPTDPSPDGPKLVDILSLTVTPNSVVGGDGATGRVVLYSPAPAGGVRVFLSRSGNNAGVPESISIEADATFADFPITTLAVTAAEESVITAISKNSVNDALLVLPEDGNGGGTILSVAITPGSVTGGGTAAGTVTLTEPAPLGGVVVTLASGDPAASVPPTVTVPAGATSVSFTISTSSVESVTPAGITATANNSVSETLTIQPAPAGAGEGTILSLVINPDTVAGGASATGTVTLAAPAPAGGILVTLASDNAAAAVPASITVPQGQTTAQFAISTTPVEATTVPQITATSANSVSDTLTIDASGPGEGEILSLVVAPDTVVGGDVSTGTVTLAMPAPAGGVLVTLASNKPAATVPAPITIAEGQTSAQFGIPTSAVAGLTVADITATSANVVSDTLTINLAPCVSSIQINLQDFLGSVLGGTSLSAIVHLTGPAPQGGLDVELTSALLDVSVPATVHVPEGQVSVGFTISTHAVSSLVSSLITATVGPCPGVEITIGVEPPCVASLNLSVGSVLGGGSILGTVALTGPAPAGGSEITLVSSDAALNAPLSVLVPEGQTSAQFVVNVAAVPTILHSTLQALLGDCPGVEVELDILAPILQSLGVSQSAFPLLGGSTTATVTLSGPAPVGGLAVQLEGSQESIILGLLGGVLKVLVPNQVVVPAGETSATFNVTASLVGTLTSLLSDHDGSITATLNATVKNVDVVIEGLL
jgi:uncharacterized protein (TIGR03437 family)